MFIPGCYCCTPPEDPCTLSGCTWTSTEGDDTELTGQAAYNSPFSGATPDGTYEVTSFQNPDLGNNKPCRQIWIDTVGGSHPTVNENVYAINWVYGATHNPSTQCPLTNVSFCVESKRGADSDSGLTDGVVFVVRQGGKIYATASQPVGVNWKRAHGTYTSSDFTWINGSSNPNFTVTGGQLEFGFALRLTVFANTEPFDSVLFDNLCVKLTKNCGGGGSGTPCDTSNCTILNTGTSLTVDSISSGASYGTDPAVGIPAGSQKVTFPSTGGQVQLVVSSDILSGQSCPRSSNILICANGLPDYDPPSGSSFTMQFILRQGSSTVSLGIGNIQTNSTGGWQTVGVSFDWPTSMTMNTADPIELLLKLTGPSNTIDYHGWIDNICVRVTPKILCRQGGEIAIDLSGLTVTNNGCNDSAAVSFLNSALSSTFILDWRAVQSGVSSCGFYYFSGFNRSGTLTGGTLCNWSVTVFADFYSNGTCTLRVVATAYNQVCSAGGIEANYTGSYTDFCSGGTMNPSSVSNQGGALYCGCIQESGFSSSSVTWSVL